MVNFAVIFGARMRGPLGALAAVAGLLGPPMILVMAVGALYAHFGDLPVLRRMRLAAPAHARAENHREVDHVAAGQKRA